MSSKYRKCLENWTPFVYYLTEYIGTICNVIALPQYPRILSLDVGSDPSAFGEWFSHFKFVCGLSSHPQYVLVYPNVISRSLSFMTHTPWSPVLLVPYWLFLGLLISFSLLLRSGRHPRTPPVNVLVCPRVCPIDFLYPEIVYFNYVRWLHKTPGSTRVE